MQNIIFVEVSQSGRQTNSAFFFFCWNALIVTRKIQSKYNDYGCWHIVHRKYFSQFYIFHSSSIVCQYNTYFVFLLEILITIQTHGYKQSIQYNQYSFILFISNSACCLHVNNAVLFYNNTVLN